MPPDSDLRHAPFIQPFDLDQNVSETINIASGRGTVVKNLNRILEQQFADGCSTSGPKLHNDVSNVLTHQNAQTLPEKFGNG